MRRNACCGSIQYLKSPVGVLPAGVRRAKARSSAAAFSGRASGLDAARPPVIKLGPLRPRRRECRRNALFRYSSSPRLLLARPNRRLLPPDGSTRIPPVTARPVLAIELAGSGPATSDSARRRTAATSRPRTSKPSPSPEGLLAKQVRLRPWSGRGTGSGRVAIVDPAMKNNACAKNNSPA